jgi:NAD+ synthase (glutamine-hydrolysing)
VSESTTLRIALAQVNATVGDVDGNVRLVIEWIGRARDAGAQLVLFPELVLSGYPAEDLWLKRHFLDRIGEALHEVAARVQDVVAVVGFPERSAAIHNSAAVLADGAVRGVYRKMLLPNYGVFDERRYFEPGTTPSVIVLNGARIGLTICEDIWFPGAPASVEALAGARLIVNPSASPYQRGKGIARERMVAERTAETGAAFAMCNTVGAQDELVFDGHSVVVSEQGETLARARQFAEDLVICDLELPVAAATEAADDAGLDTLPSGSGVRLLDRFEVPDPTGDRVTPPLAPVLDEEAEVYSALVLGLRDYVDKNRFERVLVAVSGGVDSALVALIATDALGPDRVTCVVMPSPHSSGETQADAREIVRNVGAELIEIPIERAMAAYEELLPSGNDGRAVRDPAAPGVGSSIISPRRSRGPGIRAGDEEAAGIGSGAELAAENIQARIRGNLVMALSNRTGWLVLTTGNKSELSVGYATLYGDMAGGFAVIKDVPKTLVYKLVRHRNEREGRDLVPRSVLERAPSAELRPDQLDQDSLPPYELLDRILEAYVEGDRGRDEIIADGLPADVVDEVIAMVDRSEYKRRQAPPGIKITPKAFGRDRRLPITNRFRG